MFSVTTSKEDGLQKVILRDEISETSATILPQWGALLHSFIAKFSGESIEVIEGYRDGEDIANNITSKGFKGCKLSPFVCRLHKGEFTFEGKEYSVKKFMLDKHALHGILFDVPFEIIQTNNDADSATVTLKHECRNESNDWPFDYDCVVEYALQKNNLLSIKTTVVNRSQTTMPIQDGWHPYFTLNEPINELQLQFAAKAMVEFDEELIPTGKLLEYNAFNKSKQMGSKEFDNCFLLDLQEDRPVCSLMNNRTGIGIEIFSDQSYPYLQLYTPPHRNSIAIENISGVPDAFNNGMSSKVLSTNEEAVFTTAYEIVSK